MSDLNIFSTNMIKIFINCPMKYYWQYIKQISPPSLDKNSETGKNIHALASYFLKGENISKFEKILTNKEQKLWNHLKTVDYFHFNPIGIEKNMFCKVNNFWINGRIDALVEKNNNLYILDYKTGGVQDEMTYDFQTMIYLLACSPYLKKYNSLNFVYIDLKNKKNICIPFSEKLEKEYKEKITKICTEIENFNPEKYKKPENCNCQYKIICK